MDEHIHRDKDPPQSISKSGIQGNSLTVAMVIKPRTSNGNSSTAITVTEVMDNDLAIIPGLDGYDSQNPYTSKIIETSPEMVVDTDAIETEHNSGKNVSSWINVPIVYEDNLVNPKKSSLRHWKRIIRNSTNKTVSIVTPKLPRLSKRISSQYDSLDSHTHKK
nr:hypothetical protein CFP56_47449 [Quercus suber]